MRPVDSATGPCDGHVADPQALILELRHLHLEAAALLADRVADRDTYVVEDELGGVGRVVAHLLQLATHAEARRARGDDDHAHPLVAALVGRARKHADPVGLRAGGDPQLATVDDPVVAVAACPRRDPGDVGPGSGLAHADGADEVAGQRRSEELPLELVAPEARQRGRGHAGLDRDGHRHAAHVGPAELLGEDDRVRVVGATAAELLLVLKAERPDRAQLREELVRREDLGVLPLVGVGVDLLLDELADARAELVVLGGEQHQAPLGSIRPRARAHSSVSVRTARASGARASASSPAPWSQ